MITDIERNRMYQAISRTQGALTSRFRYDPVGRLLSQAAGRSVGAQADEGPLIARKYDYDAAGNLLAIDDNRNGRTSYGYDVLGRILSAVQTDLDERFSFDPAHNLLDTTLAAIGRVEANRVLVFEDKRFNYDAHGNLTEKLIGRHTRIRLGWNAAHQLVKSVVARNAQDNKPVVQTVKYVYDAFGRRIAKRDAFGETRFVWDGNRLLCEERGNSFRTYAYEGESFVPVAVIDSGQQESDAAHCGTSAKTYYLHTDHLGTPREMTDREGVLAWSVRYRAWGNVVLKEYTEQWETEPASGLAQSIRFQGQYHDRETGLHYNRFRYYDPDVGRFASKDPIGLLGGHNLSQYAPNPTGWVDPLGLTRICNCTLETGPLLESAQRPFKDGQVLTTAGRAVTKHPEYFGFPSTDALKKVYRTDPQLNDLAATRLREVLETGAKTTGAGGRYPNGWTTYTLPDGRAASWGVDGVFIGFRGVR